MILGVDPVDLMVFFCIGMVCFLAGLVFIMYDMRRFLQRIAQGINGEKGTNSELHALRAQVASDLHYRRIADHSVASGPLAGSGALSLSSPRERDTSGRLSPVSANQPAYRDMDATIPMQRIQPK